jgi:phage-related protein
MAEIIKKYDIDTYSSTATYAKHDVVKVVNGSSFYYFVSARDNNKSNLDTGSYTSNSWWKRFDDFNNDFADVWTPSYTTNAAVEPRVINATLEDGVTQLARDGINTNILAFNLIFENVSNREAKSLLCFFELQGASRAFQWTVPEPYNKRLKFELVSISHQYIKKNVNTVSVTIQQSFVIFGVGAGQQKFGAF